MGSQDVKGDSYESVYNKILDMQSEPGGANDLRTNRQRSFNIENRYVEKALTQPGVVTKMQDAWTNWTKTNKEEGTPYNMSYSCVLLNVIPTVPMGYAGTVEVSLLDSGLSPLENVIPDQTQMMELGKGPHVMCFFMHYSIPLNDKGRAVKLAFKIDAEMASKGMSVMNVYSYWTQRQGHLSAYSEPQRSTISKLMLGYDKSLKMKTRNDVRRFVGRSLSLHNQEQSVPALLPGQINVMKENVPLYRKESVIDLTREEREKTAQLEMLRKTREAHTQRSAEEMKKRQAELAKETQRKLAEEAKVVAEKRKNMAGVNSNNIKFGNFDSV
uniref:Movement protein n=1 Tax=Soil-borne wheat mosaic virus TaxID=28375 RepID=A0A160G5Y7_SBWMV|nr:movement protein [Soil-borne wheat mosaic virus]ANI85382.1 37 kDa movement protein [Soil-borne wheat mosaic virus]QGT41044.1 movement protein [Soil-borne wheat mosaic virus]